MPSQAGRCALLRTPGGTSSAKKLVEDAQPPAAPQPPWKLQDFLLERLAAMYSVRTSRLTATASPPTTLGPCVYKAVGSEHSALVFAACALVILKHVLAANQRLEERSPCQWILKMQK